jgi:uncharacterized SAM-dependent methyltransferase
VEFVVIVDAVLLVAARPDLDVTVQFADGEEVTTETSAKCRPGGVRGWLEATGYDAARPPGTTRRPASG